MRKALLGSLPVLIWLLCIPARASTDGKAEIYDFSAASFPTMRVGVDIFDENGAVIPGLKVEQVSVLEDGLSRPILSWDEQQPGARFVLALNLGPEFARRDARGESRYAKIAAHLLEWVSRSESTSQDDLHIITNTEAATISPKTLADFRDFLTAFQPALQRLTPGPETLARALTVANDPLPRAGMKRVVLFITSLPSSAQELSALQDLTAQALALGIRVHVWIVGSTAYFTTSGATALKDLTIQTGGQFTVFSGQETLPDIEAYLTPLRRTYSLTYASAITTSGEHMVSVSVTHQGRSYVTAPLTFSLNVQPPKPFFLSPPTQIVRRCPGNELCDLSLLMPKKQELEIIIEFPDGHPRPLIRTILYVDGQVADQNTREPWDRFQWDLSQYTTTGQHVLQVEAVDSLGLAQISAGLPVTVIVTQPPAGWLRRHVGWVIGAVVFLAGVVLIAILSGVRLRQFLSSRSRSAMADVLTQPVASRKTRRPAVPPASSKAAAFLIRVGESGQPLTAIPLPLTGEISFGSDPVKAEIVLDDPSVSPRHACIIQDKNGQFYIRDENSLAGTWVNFERIEQPHVLRHGDLIQIGRRSYRFHLRHPPPAKAPRFSQKRP